MNQFRISNRDKAPIEDWRQWTRPKEAGQWKAGRSAMELARAWFTSTQPLCPPEVTSLLESNDGTKDLQFLEGKPEYVTPLPERGEGRNHDLVMWATRGEEKAILCIEAKTDELFGDLIGNYWYKMKSGVNPTRAPERIEKLLHLVFGPDAEPTAEPWASLRYQLLTGVAGTLFQAARDEAASGIFIVQEFQTHLTDLKKLQLNHDDYNRFIGTLCGKPATVDVDGQMLGPFSYPADRFQLYVNDMKQETVRLFVGKCSYTW